MRCSAHPLKVMGPIFSTLLGVGQVQAGDAVAVRQPNVVVILTDDQGFADLGAQGILKDIQTPNIDRLAREGVRFTHGYSTAPVCGPSRAGLLSGQYQERFGVYDNADLPFNYKGPSLPQRLRASGYRTGMVGKLHLPINGDNGDNPKSWGFDEFFMKHGDFVNAPKRILATHSLTGEFFPEAKWIEVEGYRTDNHTEAALQFIDRNKAEPFFLYLAYLAPHTPLEAPQKYLDRFPDAKPEARRYALAMISAIDDGVGRITDRLKALELDENTLIFFVSDNGAPLKCRDRNLPVSQLNLSEWNGSLNTPMTGEKVMLAEGGVHVPFIACWPKVIPAGQVIGTPVITLDIAATALTLAGSDTQSLDGVNLMPLLTGRTNELPREYLFWAFGGQSVVRKGNWKMITTQTSGDFLFSLADDLSEKRNRTGEYPEVAAELKAELAKWQAGCGARKPVRPAQLELETRLYRDYFETLIERQK
ncbi:MAG: sulfatase-like hydrolase/transferase [Kiritimatiellaceae bacterium]|nr:sulfatase-like hydrolase/transferase [Kiritimatiellaceae bacterium]